MAEQADKHSVRDSLPMGWNVATQMAAAGSDSRRFPISAGVIRKVDALVISYAERLASQSAAPIVQLGQVLFDIYSPAWTAAGNVELAAWPNIAPEYRPMWDRIAAKFVMATTNQKPFAYACPANCGCLWRDNGNGSMSLLGAKSQSCNTCERMPLRDLTPLYAAPPIVDLSDERAPQWQPIETAPKDGLRLVLWIEHQNARYAKDPVGEGWAGPCIGAWTEFNGGGWTWDGLYGEATAWMPIAALRSRLDGEKK